MHLLKFSDFLLDLKGYGAPLAFIWIGPCELFSLLLSRKTRKRYDGL